MGRHLGILGIMLSMSSPKIRITIGSEEDSHDVPFSEFARVVNNSYALIKNAAGIALGKGHDCSFLLSDLSHSSPASMDIISRSNIQPHAAQYIASRLKEESSDLVNGKGVDLPGSSLELWKSFVHPRMKNRISGLRIESVDSGSVSNIMQTDKDIVEAIKKIQREEIKCQTSVVGKIELLNFHNRRYLKVYPRVKKWNPVRVYFEENLRKDVIECVDKYAEIYGVGKHYPRHTLPYEMKMDRIRPLPDEESVPKLFEMRGIAPNITGGKSVQEYLDDIREE